MKILITGNLGYVGPLVVERLRSSYPDASLVGFDIGYFAHTLTTISFSPEVLLDVQHYGDVRRFPDELLQDIDAIVYLAAISNDPMGKEFEEITLDVNYKSAVRLARTAKEKGVKSFVFASSCSVYGFAESGLRTEDSGLNPLTTYAKSKINAEQDLQQIANDEFCITALRFATACGFSPRLRLDLVLNDFVASAVTTGKIEILSDGTPWRPLIHVKDMALAIEWAILRPIKKGGPFLAVNAGSNEWNYQVKDLAEVVQRVIPNVDMSINSEAVPDKRSYQVDFSLFRSLAPDYIPKVSLEDAVKDLYSGLESIGFSDCNFRSSNLMRLNMLKDHKKSGRLNEQLKWF
jgi:nucleoside-diphosphate-sugar epimerase